MDAFSVSLADGLQDRDMPLRRKILIAGTFGIFQGLMPMIGWFAVHTAVEKFSAIEPFIPWVALGLLAYLGGSMILGAIKGGEDDEDEYKPLGFGVLMTQGIATSIDALSVGFTTSAYGWFHATVSSVIIAVVTFIICLAGLAIGQRAGTRLAGKAELIGGIILIAIGIDIWATNVLM
ncbi:MAG: manganese efflux pump [Oxalobacter sp.]|nr:manganese efflux pump [Oxalobacter sp.]